MLRFCTLIFFAGVLLFAACKKGDPAQEFYFASFKAELLQLPGTPDMDVYVGNNLIDTLRPGGTIGLSTPLMLTAGKQSELIFRKKGTDTILLDTIVTPPMGEQLSFKLACSDALGIKSFLTNGSSSIGEDSASFFIFNQLPEQIQANDVTVDAYLFKSGGVDFVETGIKWENFAKSKLHPKSVVVPLTDDSGAPIQYVLKFKNTVTGDFLFDQFNADYTPGLPLTSGKNFIITPTATVNRNRWKYNLQFSEL